MPSTVVLSALQCGTNITCKQGNVGSLDRCLESIYTECARHVVIMGFSPQQARS